jgi:hypothetical protein
MQQKVPRGMKQKQLCKSSRQRKQPGRVRLVLFTLEVSLLLGGGVEILSRERILMCSTHLDFKHLEEAEANKTCC